MSKINLMFGLILVISGCAATPPTPATPGWYQDAYTWEWVKAGVTAEQFTKDKYECIHENVMTDTTKHWDSHSNSNSSSNDGVTAGTTITMGEEQDTTTLKINIPLFKMCMNVRGYNLTEVKTGKQWVDGNPAKPGHSAARNTAVAIGLIISAPVIIAGAVVVTAPALVLGK